MSRIQTGKLKDIPMGKCFDCGKEVNFLRWTVVVEEGLNLQILKILSVYLCDNCFSKPASREIEANFTLR